MGQLKVSGDEEHPGMVAGKKLVKSLSQKGGKRGKRFNPDPKTSGAQGIEGEVTKLIGEEITEGSLFRGNPWKGHSGGKGGQLGLEKSEVGFQNSWGLR